MSKDNNFALKPFGIKEYLTQFQDQDTDELIVRVRQELETLLDRILFEKRCQIYLPGGKSIDLYKSIIDDFVRAGFSVTFLDILDKEILYKHTMSRNLQIENKDYIIVTDSIYNGNEVASLIANMEGKLIKIYGIVLLERGVMKIMNDHNLTRNHFFSINAVDNENDYDVVLKRNKIYCYATMSDESLEYKNTEKEFITDVTLPNFENIVECSFKTALNCSDFILDKDETYNYKTSKRITKYVYDCNCEDKLCLKSFQINNEFILNNFVFSCQIEKRDVGYRVSIYIEVDYDPNKFSLNTNYKNCSIFNLTSICPNENSTISDDEDINNILTATNCNSCIEQTILKLIRDNVMENILNKLKAVIT